MRLFIAIMFDENMKEAVIRAQQTARAAGVEGNYSRGENMHLTLAFIGETANSRGAISALCASCGESFDIRLTNAEKFGDTLVIRAEGDSGLYELHDRLMEELESRGFSPDKKSFKPHVTIVRAAGGNAGNLSVNAAMKVKRVSLMESRRLNGKLIYTELFGKNLTRSDRRL